MHSARRSHRSFDAQAGRDILELKRDKEVAISAVNIPVKIRPAVDPQSCNSGSDERLEDVESCQIGIDLACKLKLGLLIRLVCFHGFPEYTRHQTREWLFLALAGHGVHALRIPNAMSRHKRRRSGGSMPPIRFT